MSLKLGLIILAATSAMTQHVPAGYVSNYDGDTLILSRTATTKAIGSDVEFSMTEKLKVRVENIDTPEIVGKCNYETSLAVKAKTAVRDIMTAPEARIILVTDGRQDVYGRLLARIEVNGNDLGETLIALGLARRWDGARHPWCPPIPERKP